MLILNLNPYFKPDDSLGELSGSSGSMGKEEMIEFLNDDNDEKEVIDLDKSKIESKESKIESKEETKKIKVDKDDEDDETKEDDEDDPDDELKELEEELEDPDEEQLELVTPVRRKEILAKYPKLFKDFPYLEKAYYREQKYTELLPTIDDAKEAISKAETLDKFEKDLMDGNTEKMLKAIKTESPKSFDKIIDNYLVTLSKVDERAYHHVIGNTIKHTIMAMVAEGRRSSNEALQNAAQILNQFVFASSDFVPPKQLISDENVNSKDKERENEIEQRERRLVRQKFDYANGDLNTRVNNTFRSTIEANIDPKQSMTDYVRKNASREALESLESLISTDKRFKVLVDKLWQRASEDDFAKPSIDRIRSAFLYKAKTLLPSVLKKARNEALKGMGKRITDDSDESNKNESNKKSTKKEQSHSNNSDRKPSKGIPQGMSSLDFLMADD